MQFFVLRHKATEGAGHGEKRAAKDINIFGGWLSGTPDTAMETCAGWLLKTAAWSFIELLEDEGGHRPSFITGS